MTTTELVRLSKRFKLFLDSKKLCRGETYEEVIKRLIRSKR
jgi:hypothetical protein